MVRRISFAQALINDPEIVILDEPTSGLDPISQRQVKDLILDLKKRGKTVLLSSHLLADVQDICDRIAILHQGQTKLYGPIKELLVQRDSLTMTFKGMSEETRKKIEEIAAHDGANLVRTENSMETLEDVFIRIVQESGDGLKYKPPEEKK